MTTKTIIIKLNQLNQGKLNLFSDLQKNIDLISIDYLQIKKKELETKQYQDSNQIYAQFRQKYKINSILIGQIMRFIDQTINSHISICKKKHKLVQFPEKINCPIVMLGANFHIQKSKKSTYFEYWLKYLKNFFPLKLSNYHKDIIERSNKFLTSKIKDNKLYLTCQLPEEQNTNTKALGIDLGIVRPITCSDGHIIGNGKQIVHQKLEFQKKRSSQQSNNNPITKKQFNWMKDVNHKLSRKLIDYCKSQKIGVLITEKLIGNHLSNKRFRHFTWAYKQLLDFIKYKCQVSGIKVIDINPANTSITCSSCGAKSKDNRQSQSLFVCTSCGHRQNADVNAAKNILGSSVKYGLPVNLAIPSIIG